MTAEQIRLGDAATCSLCGCALQPGCQGWWDSELREATCVDCRSGSPDETGFSDRSVHDHDRGHRDHHAPLGSAVGASAQKTYEQNHRRREERIEDKWGRMAGIVKFLSNEPQSAKAWANRTVGERRLTNLLTKAVGERAVLLHGRKVPGTRGNIDHLAIAASGVWIIDAESYSGQVEQRDVGGWFRTDQRLYVDNRDQTRLVGGFSRLMNAVLEAVGDAETPVHAALCFVDSQWGFFAKPFRQAGVWVTWPKKLSEMIAAPGSLARDDVVRVADCLDSTLPPAVEP
jgi:hypothetical protein